MRNIPPKNSTPETKDARICGEGIGQSAKSGTIADKFCSWPMPLDRDSQPTMNRAKRGASHSMCRETRSGHSKNQSIRVVMSLLCLLALLSDRLGVRIIAQIG